MYQLKYQHFLQCTYKHITTHPYLLGHSNCTTVPSEIGLINNAGKYGASHARVTSTYRSHLLSAGDVLQNLFQLLLNASSPVNHSGK